MPGFCSVGRIRGKTNVMHGVEDQLPLVHMTEFPLQQGKSAEDIAGSKDGIGQLLLAMFATFLRHGETIWGAALAPTKVNSNFLCEC